MEQDAGPGKSKQAGERKSPGVRLRISTLMMALFLACVAIATAYLAGVMSGRHSTPSLSERNDTSSSILAPNADKDANADRDTKSPNRGEHILSAEELEFARVLRRDENSPLSKLKSTSEKNAELEKKASPVEVTPVLEKPSRPSLRESLEAEKGDEASDYVFQVGAFKDEKTVDGLREKLEGHGLRTQMLREGRFYLVLVRLRGTANRAAELVALFAELGLGEPILRSRTPVAQ